ncbi:hypothetical protein PHJA_000795500 [Phtheirospermum japonicum]|uniref:Uncharacterized protein n=1 Tax=Phtheirospermum japonicum TaxID=374723 RepID=A0A830BGR1_9LAMI|nr:hypothetical protein PHJA_000795500 [Phtheirospermum japonicum]
MFSAASTTSIVAAPYTLPAATACTRRGTRTCRTPYVVRGAKAAWRLWVARPHRLRPPPPPLWQRRRG